MRRLSDRQLSIETARTFNSYPADSHDGWGTRAEAKCATFAGGDVVATDTAHGPRRALVVFVGREYSERSGDWIPRYKVRLCKADGSLGRAWRWVYPGCIDRGFAALSGVEQ